MQMPSQLLHGQLLHCLLLLLLWCLQLDICQRMSCNLCASIVCSQASLEQEHDAIVDAGLLVLQASGTHPAAPGRS
jgi:hypothetical protein